MVTYGTWGSQDDMLPSDTWGSQDDMLPSDTWGSQNNRKKYKLYVFDDMLSGDT